MKITNRIIESAALALFDIDLKPDEGSLNLVMWADLLTYLSWLGIKQVDFYVQDLNNRIKAEGHKNQVALKTLPESLELYSKFIGVYFPSLAPGLIDTEISELRKLGACGIDWPIDPESIVTQYESIKEELDHAS